MRVRITEYLNGELGPDQYAYYPGQVIVDHPHEREWLNAGTAVSLDGPIPVEITRPAPFETAEAVPQERAVPVTPETRRRRR